MAQKFLTLYDVLERTSLSKTQIGRLIRLGQFPAKVRLSTYRVAWVEEEVTKWMEDRIAARGGS